MGTPTSAPSIAPLESSAGYVMPIAVRVTDLPTAATAIVQLYRTLAALMRRVSAISFGDGAHGAVAGDLAATYIQVLSPAKPDEIFEVVHFLGRTPIGFDVCKVVGKPAIFYAPGESLAGHGWNPVTIQLQCNTANAYALLRVY